MKTVVQKWALVSPTKHWTFDNRAEILMTLATPAFLENFEVGVQFVITPVYEVVDYEVLYLESHL